jgi:pimeloyl-ACP methyl ester carboxylesterase
MTRPIRTSDLRGLTRLGVDAVIGVTDLVEAMHHTITQRAGIVGKPPPGRTKGITGFVYRAVRGTTKLAGKGLDLMLDRLAGPATPSGPPNARREALLAIVNGLWGDHLAETVNPLAIPMALRIGGHPLTLSRESLAAAFPQPGRRLLVLLHGLCMNDLQWSRNGHDHGAMLAREGGFTPLYLHYNSGLHVSRNGRALAELLEALLARWPEPVDELVLLGHSMGGLVARSALHHALTTGQAWPGTMARRWSAAATRSTCCSASARTRRRSRAWARRAARASPTCASATCRTPTGRAATATRSAMTTAGRRRCRRACRPMPSRRR